MFILKPKNPPDWYKKRIIERDYPGRRNEDGINSFEIEYIIQISDSLSVMTIRRRRPSWYKTTEIRLNYPDSVGSRQQIAKEAVHHCLILRPELTREKEAATIYRIARPLPAAVSLDLAGGGWYNFTGKTRGADGPAHNGRQRYERRRLYKDCH